MKLRSFVLISVISLALLPALLAFSPADIQGKTTVCKVLQMYIPEEFTPLTRPEINYRYRWTSKPMATYSDKDRISEISINCTNTKWTAADFPLFQKFQKATIQTYYNNLKMIKEEYLMIGKVQYLHFEFEGSVQEAKDTSSYDMGIPTVGSKGDGLDAVYSHVLYALQEGKLLSIIQTYPARHRRKWEPISKKIVASVRIKGKLVDMKP